MRVNTKYAPRKPSEGKQGENGDSKEGKPSDSKGGESREGKNGKGDARVAAGAGR